MSPAPNGRDRRRMMRRSIKRIPTAFESDGTRGNGHIKNVSKEGLFVRSDVIPTAGGSIRMLFHDRHGAKVEIHGFVRWTTEQLPGEADAKPGFGVQLAQVTDAFLDFYEQVLTR